jgi:hypothetical protein
LIVQQAPIEGSGKGAAGWFNVQQGTDTFVRRAAWPNTVRAAHTALPFHPISVRGTGHHGLAPHQTLLICALPCGSKEDSRFKLIGFFNHSMSIGEMDCRFSVFIR